MKKTGHSLNCDRRKQEPRPKPEYMLDNCILSSRPQNERPTDDSTLPLPARKPQEVRERQTRQAAVPLQRLQQNLFRGSAKAARRHADRSR